jgi:hypothetical protein
MRRRLAAAGIVLAAALGCTGPEPQSQGPAPTPGATGSPAATGAPTPAPPATTPPTASPAPDDEKPDPAEAPFTADRSRDTADHEGPRLSPVDLRVGRHEGYDRVVLELAGGGQPGWTAEYDDDPRNQGRGDQVDLRGDTALAVTVTGVQYPMEPGAQDYRGPGRIEPQDTEVVVDVRHGVLYEGYQQLFIGLRGAEQPFRVFRLADPPRVVVDVQHPR